MGTLRFFLSILVLLSHAGVSIHGYNPGVVAVMTFFIMSGYVMTLLVQRHYSTTDWIGHFYLDRAARLFPQFLLYSSLTLALLSFGLISSAYLSECTADKIALNMAILPVGYYSSLGLGKCMVIPQAWSLGLEATFYAAVPLLLVVVPRDWLHGVLAGSMVIFSLAVFGVIDADQ